MALQKLMKKLPKMNNTIKKTAKKITSKNSNKSMESISNILNYVLVIVLIALIIYTIMYIYNIHKHTTESFSNMDETASNSKPKLHVIYIYSDSCGFCRKFTPEFNTFNEEVKSNAIDKLETISKYSIDDPSVDMYRSSVKAFPTVLVVDNKGKIKESFIGYRKGKELYSDVKKVSTHV